jgi:hypothetical protein
MRSLLWTGSIPVFSPNVLAPNPEVSAARVHEKKTPSTVRRHR